MKKIYTILFLIVLAFTPSIAQFEKGTVMIGGGISGSFTTDKSKYLGHTTTNYKAASFSFAPVGGYFILNNLAVGIGLNLAEETTNYKPGPDNATTTSIDIGPFVRYYYHNFFIHGEFMAGRTHSRYDYSISFTESSNNFEWKTGIGYAWLLTRHVAVEPLLAYGATSYKDTTPGNNFKSVSPGLSFQLGFQVYLHR